MQSETKQGLQTLRRAHAFLAGRHLALALGELAPHAEALGEVVLRLEDHAAEQDSRDRSARSATAAKNELGTVLHREILRPLAQASRILFANDPQIGSAYRVPRRVDDEELLNIAHGVAERAEEHRSQFVERGLAPDFVERLRLAAAAFRDAMVVRDLEVARRASATAGLLEELGRGRRLLRLIDAMLAPRLGGHPDQLAEWRTTARFTRRRRGESEGPALVSHSRPNDEVEMPVEGEWRERAA